MIAGSSWLVMVNATPCPRKGPITCVGVVKRLDQQVTRSHASSGSICMSERIEE